MQLALEQARFAVVASEVPVGAVLVHQGVVIAAGHNLTIQNNDPTAHAEMVVIRKAAQHLKNHRLEDCELFVTLEPCAMCSGAMLHARLKRVVYGAPDPKTGTAGSVLNLFSQKKLNHQSEVLGGVMSEECALLLQSFFQTKRNEQKANASPLREDALRTPDSCFNQLLDYPWPSNYIASLPALAGLRLQYLDVRPLTDFSKVMLCLHGESEWSYGFRKHIASWVEQGYRVIAPDYIGFGKSDKPKREHVHTLNFHIEYLMQLIQYFNLSCVTLAVQGMGGLIGQKLHALDAARFQSIPPFKIASPIMENLTDIERLSLYEAPFPDAGHKAGLRALARWR